MRAAFVFTLGLSLFSAGLLRAEEAPELRVAVAANFFAPAQKIASRFKKTQNAEVTIISGSTGKLFAQISNGAPFDVFLGADTARPHRLVAEGKAPLPSFMVYARGQLALWCPKCSKVSLAALDDPTVEHVALANPKLAPYGSATEHLLSETGDYKKLQTKLVFGENIASTYALVASGSAQAGFVALSSLIAGEVAESEYLIVPVESYPAIEQGGVVVAQSRQRELAQAFLDFLKSEQALSVLSTMGYLPGKIE